jgi:hypothetical protein
MPTQGTSEPYPRWIADATLVVLALVTLGVIAYFLGVKAHIWPSPSDGFWLV